MIRVGRDVSSARLLELIPVHTAIRMMGIRRTKSPLDQARRVDHKIQKAGKGFCRFRVSILAWDGFEEVGMPSPVFEMQTTRFVEMLRCF